MAIYGYQDHKEDVLARLKRIEGQIRGLSKMVENETYCIDVLTQITAASNGLKKVAIVLLDDHIRHCVSDAEEGVGQGHGEGGDPRHRAPGQVLTNSCVS
jgi:DNA-binding FrmR family transcriptional regulator